MELVEQRSAGPGRHRAGRRGPGGEDEQGREREDGGTAAHRAVRLAGRSGGSRRQGVPVRSGTSWARSSSSSPRQARRKPARRAAARARRRGGARRPRSCSAAAASPAASTRSARCARWTCFSVNRTVNQFDVYVGTSAGSFVAALAANGVTPEEMMRVVNQQVPTPFRDIDLGQLLQPERRRVRQEGRRAAVEGGQRAARARAAARPGLGHGLRARPRRGPAVRRVLRQRPRVLHADGAQRPRPDRRLPAPGRPSCTSRRPTSTPASGSSSAPTTGTTSRSRPPCARRPRCRWSTSPSGSATAS